MTLRSAQNRATNGSARAECSRDGLAAEEVLPERRSLEAGRQVRAVGQRQDRHVLVAEQPRRASVPQRRDRGRGCYEQQQTHPQVQIVRGRVLRREEPTGTAVLLRRSHAEFPRPHRLGQGTCYLRSREKIQSASAEFAADLRSACRPESERLAERAARA